MWRGDEPPLSIQGVYQYIDRTIKQYKSRLGKIEKSFFGGVDSIQYLLHIEEIFKSRMRIRRIKAQTPKIGGLQELNLFVRSCSEAQRPGGVRETGFAKDLKMFISSFEKCVSLLSEILHDTRDLYTTLRTFCQNYQSLEGEFDLRWARVMDLELKGTLNAIGDLLTGSGVGVNPKLFSADNFSLEVAETCDTKRFPILRLFPDLFQKFHFVFYLVARWRANDQMYLEDIRVKLTKAKRMQRLTQEEYDALDTEHASILGGIVEKRIRVKCRELKETIKLLSIEATKLTNTHKKTMTDLATTERELQERKSTLSSNEDVDSSSRGRIDPLGVRHDIEVLTRRLNSLRKSVKHLEKDLGSKAGERNALDEAYEGMRKSLSRSNQLAYERSELAKDIAVINEKVRELETIFYKKTDKHNLARGYESMVGTWEGEF